MDNDLLNKEYSFLIFDEYEILRKALEIIIKRRFPESIVVVCDSIDDVKEVVKVMVFDLAIIDVSHNGIDEFSVLKKVKVLNSKIKILVFSFMNDENYKLRCFKNGASGIINKNCKEENICQAINVLLNGGSFFSKNVKLKLMVRKKIKRHKSVSDDLNTLSAREFELASMLVLGSTNLDISKKLRIATSTVSTYKKRIFLKTNTENVLQLADIFKRNSEIVEL
ncbi:response regulator [Flavobacterium sp.]|jgi:DNA-binding NarL/FixJ family response regulator|uniref:response regulator n=1 Tax=Flavobacterium sp. TaxID=239 RepID=UPI0037BF33DF